MADKAPIINFIRAVLNPESIGDLAQSGALGVCAVLIAAFGLTEVPLKITTSCLVVPNQGVDPLMTDTNAGQGRHEATDLLWAPLLT